MATNFLVYDSDVTRALFEQRWPFLRAGERVAVIPEAKVAGFKIRRPASDFIKRRFFRITAVVGIFLGVLLLMTRLPASGRPPAALILAVSIFAARGLNFWVASPLRWVAPAIPHWSPAVLWVSLLWV